MVASLELKPLAANLLPAVLELDRLCFNGFWTSEGYQRELSSPNSDLLVLSIPEAENNLTNTSLQKINSKTGETPIPQELLGKYNNSSNNPQLLGIGCLWAILDEAHITMLGVHPAYRGQGLGQALLLALLKSARERGMELATLEVRASNQAALSLYQKFGFQLAGRRKRYYQDNNEDALILWRSAIAYPQFEQTLASWHQQIENRLACCGWNLSAINDRS